MTIRIITRALACAIVAATVNFARAEEPAKPDKSDKPDSGKTEPKSNEVKVQIQDGADPKIQIKPAVPVPEELVKTNITADAQPLVDQLAEAYAKLKSLELAGDFSGDIEAAGQHNGGKIAFTASFEAPNKFRHEARDDVLVGSTGERAYAYGAQDKVYIQADAPKDKVATKELPKGFGQILLDQNPSLRLALAKDPAYEIRDNVTDIVKIDDTKVGEITCPTLKLTLKDKTWTTLALDPDSHLIRRAVLDVRAQLEARNVPDIKRAAYTVNYTRIDVDTPVKSEQFAWTPPAGAKDIKDVKEPQGLGDDQEPATALVGKEVPDFKLPGLDGKSVSRDDLKGKVYILDFWATWCPPCRASLPHLDDLYKQEKEAGLKVYAVNLREDKQTVQDFVTKTSLGLPILLDTEGTTAEPFRAHGIPETVVVGKDGKIAKVFVGFNPEATPAELKQAVDEALKK